MLNISKQSLVLGFLAGFLAVQVPHGADAARHTVPKPCFVPAHPLVQQMPPQIEVGGAAGAYHSWHLEEAQNTLSASPQEAPIRELNAVILLVDFEDQPMDSTGAYFDTIIHYLKQIYSQQSDGQLVINTTRAENVYRLPEPMAYYGLDDSIATREGQLIADAVKAADPDVDFSRFDTYLLFHAGVGQESDVFGNDTDAIWSVFFRQVDLAFWGPDTNPSGVPTADTTAQGDSVFVTSMVVVPETQQQDGFDFGIMGVVAHEFGHRFSLPDLYDTTAPEGELFPESQGIGAFGLMGAGIWNSNGWFPAEMCAWSKFFVGWCRPRVVLPEDGEQAIDLRGIVQDRRGGAVRIPLGGDEYLLIENRMRDYNLNGKFDFDDVDDDSVFTFGVDSYEGCELDWHLPQEPVNEKQGNLDGSGLLIWHIDESVIRENLFYNTVNHLPDHKGIDLEEADGVEDLDQSPIAYESFGDAKDAFFAPHATAFTPETLPSSNGYHGAQSQVWVTDISEHGETMSFKVRFGGFEEGWPQDVGGVVADYQPILFDRDGNGKDEIVVTFQTETGAAIQFMGDGEQPVYGYSAVRAEPIGADTDGDGEQELVWATDTHMWVLESGGVPEILVVFEVDPGRFHLVAADLDGDHIDELMVGSAKPDQDLVVWHKSATGTYLAGIRIYEPWIYALDWMDTSLPVSAGKMRKESPLNQVCVSARLPQPDGSEGGRLVLLNGPAATFSLGDSVAFSAPVVGDLNRDGQDDIVVAADDGNLYALTMVEAGIGWTLQVMEGWPVFIEALAGDAVSLADFDGDGYLEVLAFGPVNALYAINHNGVIVMELPVQIPGENRFTAPFLSPLVSDLVEDGGQEFLLPMADGQVRGHRLDGTPLMEWSYLGGGAYPIVSDIDDDGVLELVTVEDITVSIPKDTEIQIGDLEEDLPRMGRVIVREVGRGTGTGPWPVHRGSKTRAGYAPLPDTVVVENPLVRDLFVMPNPLREGVGGFHYRIADNVESVEITIYDITGQEVRTLAGTIQSGIDNLVPWDLLSDQGNAVAPGLYIARVQTRSPERTKTDMYTFSVLR